MNRLGHPSLRVIDVEDIEHEQWGYRPYEFVYVFWGANRQRPLYVGRTWDPGTRLASHRSRAWFKDAVTVWVASFEPNRVASAERRLIADLNPIHNIKRRPTR